MFKWLKSIWGRIRSGLMFIGKVNSILLLMIFYYLILGPVAVVRKLIHLGGVASATPEEPIKRSYWIARGKVSETEETLQRQF